MCPLSFCFTLQRHRRTHILPVIRICRCSLTEASWVLSNRYVWCRCLLVPRVSKWWRVDGDTWGAGWKESWGNLIQLGQQVGASLHPCLLASAKVSCTHAHKCNLLPWRQGCCRHRGLSHPVSRPYRADTPGMFSSMLEIGEKIPNIAKKKKNSGWGGEVGLMRNRSQASTPVETSIQEE